MADWDIGGRRSSSRASHSRYSPTPSLPTSSGALQSRAEKLPPRSISPVPSSLKPQRRVPALRIGFRNSDFDECRTERRDAHNVSPLRRENWRLPSNREELIEKYSGRNRSPTPRCYSPFRSYKLDAAELLFSRLTRNLAKYLRILYRHTRKSGEERNIFPSECRQTLVSGRHSPILPPEITENSPRFYTEEENQRELRTPVYRNTTQSALEDVETPKPFYAQVGTRRNGSQKGRIYGNFRIVAWEKLTNCVNFLTADRKCVAWSAILVYSRRKSAVEALVSVLERGLMERVEGLFARDLFLSPQSRFGKAAIVAVNCVVIAVERVRRRAGTREGLRKLKGNWRQRRKAAGVSRISDILSSHFREHFNRLRFFSEVLENLRVKKLRLLTMRKCLSRLFLLVQTRIAAQMQSFFISLGRLTRKPMKNRKSPPFSFSFPMQIATSHKKVPRIPVKSMVDIIGKHVKFRLRTAVTVWKERKPAEKSHAGRRIARITVEIHAKSLKRVAIRRWKGYKMNRNSLFVCEIVRNTLENAMMVRKISAWNRIKRGKFDEKCVKNAVFLRYSLVKVSKSFQKLANFRLFPLFRPIISYKLRFSPQVHLLCLQLRRKFRSSHIIPC